MKAAGTFVEWCEVNGDAAGRPLRVRGQGRRRGRGASLPFDAKAAAAGMSPARSAFAGHDAEQDGRSRFTFASALAERGIHQMILVEGRF